MTTPIRLTVLVAVLAVSQAACFHYYGPVLERRTDRSFAVAPGSLVRVSISGGPITVETGPPGQVRVELLEEVHASSERAGDEILADVQVTVAQQRDEVQVVAKRPRGDNWGMWQSGSVRFSATVTVPPDVRLNLNTSGGRIQVHGQRQAAINANTSGGSITVAGGQSPMTLDTSGGSIRVGAALTTLDADTSGGGITVGYVGPTARTVVLETSGGSIRVGVDAEAELTIDASTSGGHVEVEGLPIATDEQNRSKLKGSINGGAGQLRAATSGGSIKLTRSNSPNEAELESGWD